MGATAGFSATGCLSALGSGGSKKDENAYLEPPSDIYEDADYPTYGDPVPEIELLDVLSDEYVSTDQDTEYLMTFSYTSCPTECLWVVSALTHTEARVVDRGLEPPRTLVATFDPKRDTPKRLREYAERMGIDKDAGNWSLLRPESEAEAEEVLGGDFGIEFSKRSTDGGVYDFFHTTLILLVNEDGYVERTYTNSEPNPSVITNDLASLREAQRTATA